MNREWPLQSHRSAGHPGSQSVTSVAAQRRTDARRPRRRPPVRAGESVADALSAVGGLRDSGRLVSIDYLGEDVTDADTADATVAAYLDLLDALAAGFDTAGLDTGGVIRPRRCR